MLHVMKCWKKQKPPGSNQVVCFIRREHQLILIHLCENRSLQGTDTIGYFTSLYASELPHRARAAYMYISDRADKEGKMLSSDWYHRKGTEAD